MIDAALIDLTHHLSRQPPAIVSPSLVARGGVTARASERLVRDAERWNADWARDAETQVEALRVRLDAEPVAARDLHQLDRLIDLLADQTDAQASTFRNLEKRTRRFLKRMKVFAPDDATRLAAERDRLFAAYARSCLIRFELVMALRALRASHDPASRSGPVFTDPTTLEEYLRAPAA
ncbi:MULTISPECIES: hypothetical protein [Methylobacterium]|uniref:Uncharacterized protein n=2 Tax=Methylobacterium TaxID=407 RepID=A0A0C6EW24_9HYPH|nr:hypothetical protein [Methylobacterium aquaticum]BAQ44201.1 hypothetical protein Maq22A_c03850 [Methylobacterium aquaticum]